MSDFRLGEFEELVLLAVAGLGEEAYAVSVQQRIERRADRAASMGAVYSTLDRLEAKGCLASRLGQVTPEPGGRRKRFYRLTATGAGALQTARDARARMWDGIDLRPILRLS